MRLQSLGCRRSSAFLYTLISFTFLMLLRLANLDFTSYNPLWSGRWSGPMVSAQAQNSSGVTTLDVQLPSESTGVSGGTLALPSGVVIPVEPLMTTGILIFLMQAVAQPIAKTQCLHPRSKPCHP